MLNKNLAFELERRYSISPGFIAFNLPASTSQYQDYNRMDITDLAKVLHENPSQNFGFMIALKLEEEFRRVFFASSDTQEENRRPKLEVYYTVE